MPLPVGTLPKTPPTPATCKRYIWYDRVLRLWRVGKEKRGWTLNVFDTLDEAADWVFKMRNRS
jgi:hypothetical protein